MYICWTICKSHKRLGREKVHVKSFWLRMTDNVSLRAVMLARNKVVMNIYTAPPIHAPVLFMQTSTQLLVQGVYKQRRKQIIRNNRQNQTAGRILRSEHLEWRVWSKPIVINVWPLHHQPDEDSTVIRCIWNLPESEIFKTPNAQFGSTLIFGSLLVKMWRRSSKWLVLTPN